MREMLEQGFGVYKYTLRYKKQVTNKGVLYSTGNYTQCLIIAYNEKKSEKEQIDGTESFCSTLETL